MYTTTVSSRYHIIIPPEIRRKLGIEPGQKVQLVAYNNRLEIIPIRAMKEMRGFLRGIDTDVPRDRDRV